MNYFCTSSHNVVVNASKGNSCDIYLMLDDTLRLVQVKFSDSAKSVKVNLDKELHKNGLWDSEGHGESDSKFENEAYGGSTKKKKQREKMARQKFLQTLYRNWLTEDNMTPKGSVCKNLEEGTAQNVNATRSHTYPASELFVRHDSKEEEVVTLDYKSVDLLDSNKCNGFKLCSVFATNADSFKIMGKDKGGNYEIT